jgi:hypothetical protein
MDRSITNPESGVTLLEVVVASFFLTVSLLAVAGTMIQGVSSVFMNQEQLIAKQKAQEALESVFLARSTQEITWAQIQNASNGGVFLGGYQDMRGMGLDGIPNTADDAADPMETITYPGKDGNLGTADDIIVTLSAFKRQITISNVLLPNNNVDPDIRRIDIDVRYYIRNIPKVVRVSSFISRFA